MEFRTLHIGGPLRLWERCCLQSFVDFGHDAVVFGYERFDVPAGVRWEPAQDVVTDVDRERFFAARPGAISRFSDLFRYVLLDRHGGWWVDTDVLCQTGSPPEDNIVLGWEDENLICGAVMRIAGGHPLLSSAINYCWEHAGEGDRSHLGPALLTKLVPKFGLLERVSPPPKFFPIHWSAAYEAADPRTGSLVEAVAGDSPFVHLWLGRMRAMGFQTDLMPPAGSFLHARFERHGDRGIVAVEAEAVVRQIDIIRERDALRRDLSTAGRGDAERHGPERGEGPT